MERFRDVAADVLLRNRCILLECKGEEDHIHLLIDLHPDNNLPALLGATKSATSRILRKEFESELRPYFKGVAECGYEFLSSPTRLPKEKGAKSLVPSPKGEG
ncbi:transposase [Parathermosynechococcus lividus]